MRRIPPSCCRQAEQFFYFHGIDSVDRVKNATFHFEGHAQLLYKILFEEEGELGWEDFCDRIYGLFGPSELDNFTGELVKLVQTRSVSEY